MNVREFITIGLRLYGGMAFWGGYKLKRRLLTPTLYKAKSLLPPIKVQVMVNRQAYHFLCWPSQEW